MADLKGYEDMDEFGGEVDDALVELSQDVFHRMCEAHGSNPDVPADASLGLDEVLNGPLDASLPHLTEAGLRLDARIDAVKATVTELNDGGTNPSDVRLDVQIVTNEQELGLAVTTDPLGNLRRIT